MPKAVRAPLVNAFTNMPIFGGENGTQAALEPTTDAEEHQGRGGPKSNLCLEWRSRRAGAACRSRERFD